MRCWARYVSLCRVNFICQESSHRFLVFFLNYWGYCSHWNYEINSGGHHACLRGKEHFFPIEHLLRFVRAGADVYPPMTRKSCAIKMCNAGNGLNPTRDVCFLSKGRRATKKLKTNTTCYLSFRGAPAAAPTTLFTHLFLPDLVQVWKLLFARKPGVGVEIQISLFSQAYTYAICTSVEVRTLSTLFMLFSQPCNF